MTRTDVGADEGGAVTLQREGAVGIMIWRHGEQNQLNAPFVEAIAEGLTTAAADDRLRAVVVTSGLQRSWCTGLHLPWLMEQVARDPDGALLAKFLRQFHALLLQLTAYAKPVVAACNGHTMGAGAILAAACDYRLMRRDRGYVGLPAVKLSIPMSPGVVALLRATLPAASVRQLVYTGDRFGGEQARALGFVDQLHPADELLPAAVRLAARLGQSRTETFRAIKHTMRRAVLDCMRREDPPALARTLQAFSAGAATR